MSPSLSLELCEKLTLKSPFLSGTCMFVASTRLKRKAWRKKRMRASSTGDLPERKAVDRPTNSAGIGRTNVLQVCDDKRPLMFFGVSLSWERLAHRPCWTRGRSRTLRSEGKYPFDPEKYERRSLP